ncbi:preprotein translocase subunit YajC [Smaragdicoccus niigatensis]|uniref:preprotein translocase subunit YajC n=1 Tax=Smaragdicoccus niigatensis TaxID=359359 RepID=UPI00036C3965|nr:preprotein translocase subunit YajC [Smaragdicoccus niigatensis]
MGNYLFLIMLLILMVPMFLAVRRQKKEMGKVAGMLATLMVGDRVMTSSGLYGTIVAIDDETVDLEIAEDIVTTWKKGAVVERFEDEVETDDADVDASNNAPTEH